MNIFYIQFIFYHCQRLLFTLRVSSLLSSPNDASVDIVDDEGSVQFSPEVEFTLHLHVHITFATDTEAGLPWFAQLLECKIHIETLSIQMTFKHVIACCLKQNDQKSC